MPKGRKGVELTESAKRKLKDLDRVRTTGSGGAARAGEETMKRKSKNRSALDQAQKSFRDARRS